MQVRRLVFVVAVATTSPLVACEEPTEEVSAETALSQTVSGGEAWASSDALAFAERLNAIAEQTEALLKDREKLHAAENERFEMAIQVGFAVNAAFFAFLGTWNGLWSHGMTRAMLRAFHKAEEKSNE